MTPTKAAPLEGLTYTELDEMVRRALPTARRIVTWGITDREGHESMQPNSLSAHLIALLGHDCQCECENVPFSEWGQAAYALGIAVGLQLRADAFTQGGAK